MSGRSHNKVKGLYFIIIFFNFQLKAENRILEYERTRTMQAPTSRLSQETNQEGCTFEKCSQIRAANCCCLPPTLLQEELQTTYQMSPRTIPGA